MNRKPMFKKLREALAESPPEDIDVLSTDVEEFNRQIGLPVHPKTGNPSPLLQYQLDLIRYAGSVMLVVKSNKIGVTEAILRDVAMKGTVGDCRGFQLMLAAQDMRLATRNMSRLQELFFQSPLIRRLVRARTKETLELRDGTMFLTMPRTAEARRGWDRAKYIFLDEAAHSGFLDDEGVLAATTSRLANTGGYLRIASTPKGQRGFFHRLVTEAMAGKNTMKVTHLPYTVAVGKLIDEDFIASARRELGPLFPQEYECAFLGSGMAAFPAELVDSSREDYEVQDL